MRSLLFYCFFYFVYCSVKAQVGSGINMTLGVGASYFFNDPSLDKRVGNTRFVGINYVFCNKNQHLAFNPGLNFQTNQYGSRVKEDLLTQINQNLLSMTLDMLLKMNKRSYLRAGFFFNKIISSDVNIVSKYNGNGSLYYGSSELEKDYHPANLQAGVTLGLSIPFKLFKRYHKFNIKFVEFASALVKQDYILSKAIIGKDTKVISQKARPTMLIIGFDFNFKHIKKKKEDEE